jgi:hypothetical protein
MHAIETNYKGYRFRSRLEARWAVFFDALGMSYHYEPEGYDLGELGWYLPDFWLPGQECWVEIKPVDPDDEQRSKCCELAHGLERPFVITAGPPGLERLFVYCSDCTDSSGGTQWWDHGGGFCEPSSPHWSMDFDGAVCICSGNDWSSRDFLTPDFMGVWRGMNTVSKCRHDAAAVEQLSAAVRAARGARFEHGEVPRL